MYAVLEQVLHFLRGKSALDQVREQLAEMSRRVAVLEAEHRIRHLGRIKVVMGGLADEHVADVRPLFRD